MVLAGEYAVLLPGASCLVAAVDRHLEASAQPAAAWSARSEDIVWTDGEPVPEALSFVVEAISEVRLRWPAATPRSIETRDGLRDALGRKFGLGGSAAATVAAAFAAASGTGATHEELWAVCDEVHRRVQGGRGSGADVASAVHGGVVRYLRDPRAATAVAVHPDIRLVLAWTGASVKTAPRLASFETFVREHPLEARAFVESSNHGVDVVSQGLASASLSVLRDGLLEARTTLQRLERLIGLELETPALAKAADVAWREGAAGKFSGAGGGDCAVIIAVGDEQADRVAKALVSEGLEPVRVGLSGGVDVVGS